jgi:squalene synthase HpnC
VLTRNVAGARLGFMDSCGEPRHVADAYRHCQKIAESHYENFTVGSWLLPRRLRRHIAAIYAFSRVADDMADEGDRPAEERLQLLDAWERELELCFQGRPRNPIFVALGRSVEEFDLPIEPFRRLLRAFRSDVVFSGFDTADALLAYCRCSANPVGHLVLNLFGYRDSERQDLADKICTGLQLANFWQDVSVDARKGRIYVPRDALASFGCSGTDLMKGTMTAAVRDLVESRLAREVRLFAWGGLAILHCIEAENYDVLAQRPTVPRWTQMGLIFRALFTSRHRVPELRRSTPTKERQRGVA